MISLLPLVFGSHWHRERPILKFAALTHALEAARPDLGYLSQRIWRLMIIDSQRYGTGQWSWSLSYKRSNQRLYPPFFLYRYLNHVRVESHLSESEWVKKETKITHIYHISHFATKVRRCSESNLIYLSQIWVKKETKILLLVLFLIK